MAEIKAIETVYNGYKFRSRLEARWAVFFESAGIEYQYEPEGFVLVDGTHYLPDFYLPKMKGRSGPVYVEVKGDMTNEDLIKIDLFTNRGCGSDYHKHGDYDGKSLYVVSHIPKDFDDMINLHNDDFGTFYNFNTIDGDWYGAFFYKFSNGDVGICGTDNMEDDDNYPFGFEWFNPHFTKARQARFEHGEKG